MFVCMCLYVHNESSFYLGAAAPVPKGYWPLSPAAGLRDVSGNGNHAVLYGNVVRAQGVQNELDAAFEFHG